MLFFKDGTVKKTQKRLSPSGDYSQQIKTDQILADNIQSWKIHSAT